MKQIIILILTCICWDAFANIPYYFQDYPYYPYISIVDKSKFELKTFQFHNNKFEEILFKKIATGKNIGNKEKEGDGKTPEGIYFTQHYSSEKQLKRNYGEMANLYGVGAWTLDYPNAVDQKIYKKTGTGIWIHGTNDPDRIENKFSSRGCVVLKNNDFNEFQSKVKAPHPVLINEAFVHLDDTEVSDLKKFISHWKTDWELTDNQYFSHYHKSFLPENKMKEFKQYKQSMFNNRKNLMVSFDNVNILKHKDYYHISFVQRYKDSQFSDVGFKTMNIIRNDGSFKIVDEQWTDLKGIDKQIRH